MVSVLSGVDSVAPTGDPSIDRICDAALHAVRSEAAADQVFTGGVSTVANAFDAVDVVRSVLQTLEQQFVVVTLVSDIVNRGMSVAIGVEHGVEPLSACSVVVAPVVDRRGASRIDRRARPDPDELSAGTGHRRRGQRAARPPHRGRLRTWRSPGIL